MGKFTAKEKAECAEREVKQRQYVYPRRVADGKMSQELANRQLAMMEEIGAEYRARADDEEAQGRLI